MRLALISISRTWFVAACIVAGTTGDIAQAAPTFTTLDVAGAVTTGAVIVDRDGDVAGTYVDGQGQAHGWYKIFNVIYTFDCPGAVSMDVKDMAPNSTNTEYFIYGTYTDAKGREHGFQYSINKESCTAWQVTKETTSTTAANEKGAAVGSSLGTPPATTSLQQTGYYRKPSGKFVVIDVPAAQYGVQPADLNDKNQVTGTYDGYYGFEWDLSTRVVAAIACEGVSKTVPTSINNKGAIAGGCGDYTSQFVGFVRDGSGNIITFHPTGAISTNPTSINLKGQIAGYYKDNSLTVHGFLRTPKGKIARIDPPGSSGTYPMAINDSGVIVGYFYDADGNQHGFERDP